MNKNKAPQVLSDLKNKRSEFNKEIWLDYRSIRKSFHERITALKNEIQTKQTRAEKSFIRKALKNAGTAELSDNLVIKDSKYGRLGIYLNTKPYHAQALLRSDMELSHTDKLELAELFLEEPIPKVDTTELDALEEEFAIVDDYKRVLKNQPEKVQFGENEEDFDMSIDSKFTVRSPVGSPTRTIVEMQEYLDIIYKDNKSKPMSRKQAEAILAKQQTGNMNQFMSKEEMAKHIDSYNRPKSNSKGKSKPQMQYHGPRGLELHDA